MKINNSNKHKLYLVVIPVVVLTLFLILNSMNLIPGISHKQKQSDVDTNTSEVLEMKQDERDIYGSKDAVDVNVGLIIGPPSMGLTQFMALSDEGSTYNKFKFSSFGVDYKGLAAAFSDSQFDICTLPSNIGPVLYNNKDLKQDFKVISVNNLGLLYVMTKDDSIKTIDDLKGKTIYSYGEGGTPEFSIRALLEKLGLEKDVTLEFKSSPFEVLNIVQKVEGSVCILPEPFVSLAKSIDKKIVVPIDLSEVWSSAFKDNSSMVTTITLVRNEFLEEHEQAVIEYLRLSAQSVSWTLENPHTASKLQEKYDTFLNDEVADVALEKMNMVCLVGPYMTEAYAPYIYELSRYSTESIGGTIPDTNFYYMPPLGALSREQMSVGVK